MRILFCSDALVVDGVTSFVLQLAVALKNGGHTVAVLGRWAGRGFQPRLRQEGVKVIQCISPTVGNFWFDRQAEKFAPDVIVTDSNRSFPLAQRLKIVTGALVFTFFLDPPAETAYKKGRSIPEIINGSDAWFSTETPILGILHALDDSIPKFLLRRPLVGLINPTPLQTGKDPFRVLCISRLSGFKSDGPFALLKDSLMLKRAIPSLEITFVGGGWRVLKLAWMARAANRTAGEKFVRAVGTKIQPQPWYEWASVICAGSTSGVEGTLANRPVISFTYYWLGMVTPDNAKKAVETFFAQKATEDNVRDNPGLISSELLKLYKNWDSEILSSQLSKVRSIVEPHFESAHAAREFERYFSQVSDQAGR